MTLASLPHPSGTGVVMIDIDDAKALAEYRAQVEAAKVVAAAPAVQMKIDLGCGPNKREGFVGADIKQFPGVDVVIDLGNAPWPWTDQSVDEAYSGHLIEHLHPKERVHFVNELYRVLKPRAMAQIVVPPWSSGRAYGDLSHVWPPVSEFWFGYLNREWRMREAPHLEGSPWYTCDFDVQQPSFTMHDALQCRNQEYQAHAVSWYKEAGTNMIAWMRRRP